MDGPIIHKIPERKLPNMIVAFAGWGDAAQAPTRALRYLKRTLSTEKIAEIDPEEFYDFTSTRPKTLMNDQEERYVGWPSNNFHAHVPDDDSPGLLLFSGTEPSLKWKTYCNLILDVADRCGVETMVSLGSLFNTVPHSRPLPVSSIVSSRQELAERVTATGAFMSPYQGPTAIHTVLAAMCNERGLPHASFWGHGPHYLPSTPNPKLSYTLLDKVRQFLDIQLDLEELRSAGDRFEQQATEAIASQEEVVEYVRRLEEAYDASQSPESPENEVSSPDAIIHDLEEFLKSQRPTSDTD
jgi:proteasome assembly chaperone (PAC2) family protein